MMSSAFSNFFRDLPETLQQPAALAMLGSVGAHLILFATLPAFTSSPSPDKAEIRRVRLLEPPQGSSAPRAATSQLGLPPVPNSSNSKIQLPQAGQTTSPIPNPLYTIPDLTPTPAPEQPQIRTSQDSVSELLRRLAIRSEALRNQKLAQENQKPAQEKTQARSNQNQPDQRQPNQRQPNQSQANPPSTPSPGGLDPADASKVAAGSTPPPPGAPNQPGQTQTPAPTPPVSGSRLDQILAATRYNPQGTTAQELLSASTNFTQALTEKGIVWERILLRKPEEPIQEVDFPQGWVLQDYEKRQHPVAIAVLVDKNGKPLPDTQPEILSSTGYAILNQKAKEIVQANATPEKLAPLIQNYEAQKADPKTRNKTQAYLLVYEFKFKAPNGSTASTPTQRN